MIDAERDAHGSVAAALRAAGCVFAEQEADLLLAAAAAGEDLRALVERRTAGVPLEHVLGWAEFHGHRVRVGPGVFVPRRRTELLVLAALRLLDEVPHTPPRVVVDLCCGSGAVGMAVATAAAGVQLHATDLDPASVAWARRNLAGLGQVHLGDLTDPLPAGLRGRTDVMVACPPYVPSGSVALMPTEARDHEPRTALDGGADGLDVVRRIAATAPAWLCRQGALVLETSTAQAPAVATVLQAVGLRPVVLRDADLGATAVVGRRQRGRSGLSGSWGPRAPSPTASPARP